MHKREHVLGTTVLNVLQPNCWRMPPSLHSLLREVQLMFCKLEECTQEIQFYLLWVCFAIHILKILENIFFFFSGSICLFIVRMAYLVLLTVSLNDIMLIYFTLYESLKGNHMKYVYRSWKLVTHFGVLNIILKTCYLIYCLSASHLEIQSSSAYNTRKL